MVKRAMNIHVTNPNYYRREHQVLTLSERRNVDSVIHWFKPDETKASTNALVVSSNSL